MLSGSWPCSIRWAFEICTKAQWEAGSSASAALSAISGENEITDICLVASGVVVELWAHSGFGDSVGAWWWLLISTGSLGDFVGDGGSSRHGQR